MKMKMLKVLLAAIVLALGAPSAMAQGRISKPDPIPKPNPYPNPVTPTPVKQQKLSQQPFHLTMSVTKGGKRYFVTQREWKAIKNKNAYTKEGICIVKNGYRFVVNPRESTRTGVSWYDAMRAFGNQLPTKGQADALQQSEGLREACRAFFGQDDYGNWYWTSTTCDDEPDCAYIYCPGIPDAACDRAEKSQNSPVNVITVTPIY